MWIKLSYLLSLIFGVAFVYSTLYMIKRWAVLVRKRLAEFSVVPFDWKKGRALLLGDSLAFVRNPLHMLCGLAVSSLPWASVAQQWPTWSQFVYFLVLAWALFYLTLKFVALPLEFRGSWESGFLLLLIFVAWCYLGWGFRGTYGQLAATGQLPFTFVAVNFLYVLVPFVSFIKVVVDSSRSAALRLTLGLLGFVLADGYLLFMIGLYNLGPASAEASVMTVMHYGGKHLFTYPDPGTSVSIIPFIQFGLGFLFNVVTVGFFVSYFASLFPGGVSQSVAITNAPEITRASSGPGVTTEPPKNGKKKARRPRRR